MTNFMSLAMAYLQSGDCQVADHRSNSALRLHLQQTRRMGLVSTGKNGRRTKIRAATTCKLPGQKASGNGQVYHNGR